MTLIPQPYNEEAEKSFLSASFQKSNVLFDYNIKSGDFYHEAHQEIFKALCEEGNLSEHIDIISVVSRLDTMKRLEYVGGATYISKLASYEPTTTHAEKHAKIIIEHSKKRKLLNLTLECQEQIEDKKTADEVLAHIETGVTSILLDVVNGNSFRDIDETVDSAYKEILDCINKDPSAMGVKTGFRYLDKILTGLKPEQLIILAARPSVGKSALALCMATNMVKIGKSVGIVSLEMSSNELLIRLFSSISGVNNQDMKNGELDEVQMMKLGEAIDKIKGYKLYIDDGSVSTMQGIMSKARQLKRMKGVDVLIVDYLQLVRWGEKTQNKNAEVSEISRSFKLLAKELKIPVILLSQLSRSVEKEKRNIPTLSDLRDSGAIEQDADVVLMLTRKVSLYEKDEDPVELSRATVYISKNRAGSTGQAELHFDTKTSTFRDSGEVFIPAPPQPKVQATNRLF